MHRDDSTRALVNQRERIQGISELRFRSDRRALMGASSIIGLIGGSVGGFKTLGLSVCLFDGRLALF